MCKVRIYVGALFEESFDRCILFILINIIVVLFREVDPSNLLVCFGKNQIDMPLHL